MKKILKSISIILIGILVINISVYADSEVATYSNAPDVVLDFGDDGIKFINSAGVTGVQVYDETGTISISEGGVVSMPYTVYLVLYNDDVIMFKMRDHGTGGVTGAFEIFYYDKSENDIYTRVEYLTNAGWKTCKQEIRPFITDGKVHYYLRRLVDNNNNCTAYNYGARTIDINADGVTGITHSGYTGGITLGEVLPVSQVTSIMYQIQDDAYIYLDQGDDINRFQCTESLGAFCETTQILGQTGGEDILGISYNSYGSGVTQSDFGAISYNFFASGSTVQELATYLEISGQTGTIQNEFLSYLDTEYRFYSEADLDTFDFFPQNGFHPLVATFNFQGNLAFSYISGNKHYIKTTTSPFDTNTNTPGSGGSGSGSVVDGSTFEDFDFNIDANGDGDVGIGEFFSYIGGIFSSIGTQAISLVDSFKELIREFSKIGDFAFIPSANAMQEVGNTDKLAESFGYMSADDESEIWTWFTLFRTFIFLIFAFLFILLFFLLKKG